MSFLKTSIARFRTHARNERRKIFRSHFGLTASTRILDLGSQDGTHIAFVLDGSPVRSENVYIADIRSSAIKSGHEKFGFQPVLIAEADRLPFEDGFFDIVYCSSVIEHVSVPKEDVWSSIPTRKFVHLSRANQRRFAREICRVGKSYFVQTPNRRFPVESHSWLPFLGYLPRPAIVQILRLSNSVWIKQTVPDWCLLTKDDLATLFPGSKIVFERSFGIVKSIIAIG